MANGAWSEKVVQLLRRMNSFYFPGTMRASWFREDNLLQRWLALVSSLLRLVSPQLPSLRGGRSARRLDSSAGRRAALAAPGRVRPTERWRCFALRSTGLVREKVPSCWRGAAGSETGEPLHLPERMERRGERARGGEAGQVDEIGMKVHLFIFFNIFVCCKIQK